VNAVVVLGTQQTEYHEYLSVLVLVLVILYVLP